MEQKISNKDCLALVLNEIYNDKGEDWFTEFELTVKAWRMFEDRFGLRGYEKEYPNHKSVCNLYMSGKKDSNAPIPLGWLIKHPNEKNMYKVGIPTISKARNIKKRILKKEGKSVSAGDSSLDEKNKLRSKTLILEQTELTELWRSSISPCMKYYIENNDVSPDFNSSIDFLGLRNVSRSQSSKIRNEHKKGNQSRLVNMRHRITKCLNGNYQEYRLGPVNNKYRLERNRIIQMAKLYNLVIIRWDRLISKMVMEALVTIDIPELIEENSENVNKS